MKRTDPALIRVLNDYRDALTIIEALVAAVDEARLPDDVRAALPLVVEQLPATRRDLDDILKAIS